jgi:hypothetical protein
MIGGWDDWQNPADRLDPICISMPINKAGHRVNERSSVQCSIMPSIICAASPWAKYADALRNISLTCRSSRFSRFSALRRSASRWAHRRACNRPPLFSSPTYTVLVRQSRFSRQSIPPGLTATDKPTRGSASSGLPADEIPAKNF